MASCHFSSPQFFLTISFQELLFCFENGILTVDDYESNKLETLVEFFKSKESVLVK